MFFMILLLQFWQIAFAQSGCIELEGLNLGCVSSVDHGCFRNVSVNKPDAACTYVADPGAMYRVEGPVAWACKSHRNTETCTEQVTPDGVKRICTTSSQCVEYYPPSCSEACRPCFNRVETAGIGLERGCFICTRKPCADEPLAQKACPPTYNDMVLGSSQKCSGDERCPTTAIDPLGNSHSVTVRRPTECKPPDMPPKPPVSPAPLWCPWKVDKRSRASEGKPAGGCEPIDPDNRNP